ncbi:hypothetical protein [Rhizobium sp. G21]|uniref:hypothetical protein n=1 Tax=Rhizobium sp. G21 TaxID=2758439 RepID=UPI001601A8E9|nr:hypothetical protein [Rhizobium sp. G21]MBB1247469.1 hypothetical protein [Rhizobium sp. G21]
MLFDFTKKPAPTGFSVTAKPFGNVGQWSDVADALHSFYRLYRYESAADATADVGGAVAAETPRLKVRDDAGLTIGHVYGYRVASVDSYDNESLKSLVDTATAKVADDADVDLTGTLAEVSTEIGAAVAAEAAARAAAVAAEAEARAARDVAVYQDLRAQSEVAAETASYLIEVAMIAADAQQTLRREVTTQANSDRSTFSEQINQAVAANSALVSRTTTLEAETASLASTIQDIELAYVAADEALAQTIESVAVGTNTQFDPSVIWYFDADIEGWAGNGTPAVVDGYLIPATHGSDPYVTSPAGLAIAGGSYRQVRARAKRTGAPTWEGWLWWKGSGDTTWDSSRRVSVTEPAWDGAGFGEITVNAGWTGTIAQIRLDLTTTSDASNLVALDWVSIGRPSPGASSAALTAEQTARISADAAQVGQITSLTGRMTSAESGITGAVGGLSALTGRVETTEDAITAQAARIDGVEALLDDKASVTALDTLAAEVTAFGGADGVSSIGQATRTIRNELDLAASEAIEASVADFLARADLRAAEALATQGLNTRIDVTDTSLIVLSESVTSLSATVAGKASTSSVETLTGRVTVTESGIDALNEAVTALDTEVDGKASTSSVTSLGNRVTTAEGGITALNSAVTALQTDVTGKASTSSVTSLGNRVTTTESGITALNSAVTALQTDVTGKASTSSVTSLGNRVTTAEGGITALNSAVTALQTDVTGKASTSSVTSLDNRVTTTESGITALNSAVTALQTDVTGKASTSSVTSLGNRVTTAEGGITALNSAVTALQTDVTGKASTSSVTSLGNRVTTTESGITALNSAVTALQTDVTGKASTSSVTSLGNRVTTAEGGITALNSAVTALDTEVDGKASASSVTSLGNRVTTTEGGITALNNAVTSLTTTVAGKASASSVTSLGNRVTETEEEGIQSLAAATTELFAGDDEGNVASARFRMVAVGGPTGWVRLALQIRAQSDDDWRQAGFYMEARNDGTDSRIVNRADRYVLMDGDGVTSAVYRVSGGVIYLGEVNISDAIIGNLQVRRANIPDGELTAAKISVTRLSAISAVLGNVDISDADIGTLTVNNANIESLNGVKLVNLTVDTDKIKNGAITEVDSIAQFSDLVQSNSNPAAHTITLANPGSSTVFVWLELPISLFVEAGEATARRPRGA